MSFTVSVGVGERGQQLHPGADPELGEDLAQMKFDGPGAQEQLGGDLGVRKAFAGEAGDVVLLVVSWSLVVVVRLRAVAPVASSSRPARRANPSIPIAISSSCAIAVAPAHRRGGVLVEPFAIEQVPAGEFCLAGVCARARRSTRGTDGRRRRLCWSARGSWPRCRPPRRSGVAAVRSASTSSAWWTRPVSPVLDAASASSAITSGP